MIPNVPTTEMRLALRHLPQKKPVMFQQWRDLGFFHWEYDPAIIQRSLPNGLTVDTFDGKAYLGVVPFFMDQIRLSFAPPVPYLSWFMETNVRTYVYDENGIPGVWFYSLDTNQPLAVTLARRFFGLPYYHAKMKGRFIDGAIHYATRRRGVAHADGSYFIYQPTAPVRPTQPDTLEFFLLERYILFSKRGNRLAKGLVHHIPYQVAVADLEECDARLLTLNQFPDPGRAPDLAHYSPGVSVNIYSLM